MRTACAMASEVEPFTIANSMIRGQHVYKDAWSSFIAEVLHYCCGDIRSNHYDTFAVVTCKGVTQCVVGYLPMKISTL